MNSKSRENNSASEASAWEFASFFPTKDMQTPPLSFDLVFMDDAQCAETNEKLNKFFFLIFIFRVIVSWDRAEMWLHKAVRDAVSWLFVMEDFIYSRTKHHI